MLRYWSAKSRKCAVCIDVLICLATSISFLARAVVAVPFCERSWPRTSQLWMRTSCLACASTCFGYVYNKDYDEFNGDDPLTVITKTMTTLMMM